MRGIKHVPDDHRGARERNRDRARDTTAGAITRVNLTLEALALRQRQRDFNVPIGTAAEKMRGVAPEARERVRVGNHQGAGVAEGHCVSTLVIKMAADDLSGERNPPRRRLLTISVKRWLSDNLVIFGVGTDPYPHDTVIHVDPERSMV